MGVNEVIQGDCFEVLKQILDKSVNLVLTYPPYGKMWTRGKNGIGELKERKPMRK